MLSWTVNEIRTRRQGILESGSVTFGAVFARPAPQRWVNCSQVRERRSLPLHTANVGVHSSLQGGKGICCVATGQHCPSCGQERGMVSILSDPSFLRGCTVSDPV